MVNHLGCCILIAKNMKLSATTSVKGGNKRNTNVPRSMGVRNAQPAISNERSSIPKSRSVVNQTDTVFQLPSRFGWIRHSPEVEFRSKTIEGHKGILVSGSMFVGEVQNLSEDSNETRYSLIKYLHPEMITGKAAVISQAFEKYRFLKAKLHFMSGRSTSSVGDVFLGLVSDPNVDPTVLTNRQIKAWFESNPDSFRGQVFTPEPYAETEWYNLAEMTTGYFNVRTHSATLDETYQAKIMTGTSAVSGFTGTIGDLYMDFEVFFCDAELSVEQILLMPSVQPTQTLSVNALAAGDPVVLDWVTVKPVPEGVYSYQARSNGSLQNKLDKLYQYGSEFIATVVADLTGLDNTITLFDSMADLIAGNPSKTNAITSSGSPIAELMPLLTNTLDFLPFLLKNGVSHKSVRDTKSWWRSTRGFAVSQALHERRLAAKAKKSDIPIRSQLSTANREDTSRALETDFVEVSRVTNPQNPVASPVNGNVGASSTYNVVRHFYGN